MFKESENGQTHFCSECERLSRELQKKDNIIYRILRNTDCGTCRIAGRECKDREDTIVKECLRIQLEYFTKLTLESEE